MQLERILFREWEGPVMAYPDPSLGPAVTESSLEKRVSLEKDVKGLGPMPRITGQGHRWKQWPDDLTECTDSWLL